MSNYIGVKCPVCSKKFIQSDDIVVCPICGAPHHRGCYAEKNECAFVSDHLSGKEWRSPTSATDNSVPGDASKVPFEQNQGAVVCPSCGADNLYGAIFCQICGRRMSGPSQQNYTQQHDSQGFPWNLSAEAYGMPLDPSAMIYGGLSPEEKIEGETSRDLAVYVGQNSAYYLPRFKAIDQSSRTMSFNFSAFLFNFMFYFYRKMYLIGALLLGLFVIGVIPSFLQAKEIMPQILYAWNFGPDIPVNQAMIAHYQSLANMSRTINFFIGLILSFCANRFYYSKALADVKKIRESRKDPPDEMEYSRTLSEKGGVSKSAVIVASSAIFAAYFLAVTVLSYLYMKGL